MNKTVLGLTGLAAIALATVPFGIVNAAETADSIESKATVTFSEESGRKTPLNPSTPITGDTKNTVTPLNPDGTDWSDTRADTKSALTIDYASSFDFGTPKISATTQTYAAKAQQYKVGNDTKTGPNYVQVTDARSGVAKGWALQVTQPEAFKSEKNNTSLIGTIIHVTNGTYQQVEFANGAKANSTVDITPTGTATSVMTADSGNGRGTSLYTMGTTNNADSSVNLEVPGTSTQEADTYTTKLNWTLLDAPK